jgi:outer membrane protein assembly factor BamB
MELRNGEDFVVSLDAATGKEQWSTRVGPTYRGHDGSDDGPIATPAIAGDAVFATGPNGHLLALDAATGKERWRHDLTRDFGASIPGWGFGSSPLVEGNLIVIPTGGEKSRGLLAFDRRTGRQVWSAPHVKATTYSSAVTAEIGGIRQIVAGAGDGVFGVSPEDGRLIWRAAGPGGSVEVANSPVILPGDRVLLTYWQESVMLKVSRTGGTLTAAEVWRSPMLRGANGPTIYRDGFLYGFAGAQLVCVQADTGAVRWRERTGAGTLVGAGSTLLFLNQSTGDLRLHRASPDAFAEQLSARVLTPDVTAVTGPSVTGSRVFIRNIREIAAYEIAPKR